MGGIFCAVFVTTVSQDTAMYYKQQTCAVLTYENKNSGAQSGFMQAKLMNTNFINAMMCSATCPCGSGYKSLWANQFNETELKDSHRTWNDLANPPMVPMNFNYDESDTKHTYNTFDDCLNTQIIPNEKQVFGTDEK